MLVYSVSVVAEFIIRLFQLKKKNGEKKTMIEMIVLFEMVSVHSIAFKKSYLGDGTAWMPLVYGTCVENFNYSSCQ